MSRTWTLVGIVVVGLGLTAAAQQGGPPPFPPIGGAEPVADNLYVVPGEGGNTAVFVTASGVVLVDTKLPNNGQAILDQVKMVTDQPVTTIINTHTHGDHVGSNGFFPASVEVVAHVNAGASMAKTVELAGQPSALPDRTYSNRLTLGSGPDRIELYHFGAGHTNGDTLVVFTAARTMHTGDLFAWKAPPFLDASNGGSGVAYPDTLERALRGIQNVDAVITGHMGATQQWADLVEYAEFNRSFVTYVQGALQAGRTADQAADELTLPDRFSAYIGEAPIPGAEFLGSPRAFAGNNVRAVYQELTAAR